MSRHPRPDDNTEPSFLKRWSRRKARSGRSEEEEEVDRQTPSESESEPVEEPASSPPTGGAEAAERVKTDADMPDLDCIDENTNMGDFFSPGVSQELRTQALRRLFRLSKFNVVDGLDDYAENYRSFTPLGELVTADMRYRMEMARRRLGDAGDEKDTALDEESGAARPAQDGAPEESEDRRAGADTGEAMERGETNLGGTDADSDAESQA